MPALAQYGQTQSQYGQTVTITFNDNGGNNGSINQVVIDGRSYSANGTHYNNGRWNNTNTSSNYGSPITVRLQPGQHSLEVYGSSRNNRYGNANNALLNSSNFTLRQGYDANIVIKGNDRAQISETQSGYNNGGYNNGRTP